VLKEKEKTVPLVRIDLRKGKDAAYRQEIGRVVYEALISVGVPKDDRFQVIGEHEAENFLFDSDYIGIHRTEELVIIQITWNEGRSTCLGTATFGGKGAFFAAWGDTGEEQATRLVDMCLDFGLNMFDSADVYSAGLAEEILGVASRLRRP
jgi:hypothetical protein